jgi:hypothetical protein
MMSFIQGGRNEFYPREIEVWRKNEILPSWISDNCRIVSIRDNGELVPDIRSNSRGGFDILEQNGHALVSTSSESDYICYGDSKIFPLSELQLELLYKLKN